MHGQVLYKIYRLFVSFGNMIEVKFYSRTTYLNLSESLNIFKQRLRGRLLLSFNLRRRDQTGEFLFGIRPLVCLR